MFATLVLLAQPGEARAQWVNNGNDIYNTNAGNVGIGTATPENAEGWSRVLDILGGPHTKLTVRTNSIEARFLVHNYGWWGAPAGMMLGTQTGHPLSFATGGVSRMTIADSGNVGIGMTSPTSKLSISDPSIWPASNNGALYVEASNTIGSGLNLASTGAGGRNFLLISTAAGASTGGGTFGIFDATAGAVASSYRFVLNSAGNVGIGTLNPGHKLEVAGSVRSTSGGFVFPDGTTQTTAATGASGAASISAGQFGQNAGGGNFSFPAMVLMNGGTSAIIDSSANNRFRVCGPNGWCSTAGEYIGGRIRLSGDGGFANAEGQVDPGMGGINAPGNAYVGGNVGIGTTAPTAKLHVAGNVVVDGNLSAKYQDIAEWVPTLQIMTAGTVVVLDPEHSNHVLASTESYDTSVAGVVSAQPGIALGESGQGKVLVATTGRVKVRVDATRAPIRIGDLLVTSDVAGVAMKSEPVALGGRRIHSPGTIVGKALEPLAGRKGEILVLLSLQ